MGFLTNAKDTLMMRILPPRRMSEARRRELRQAIANDPNVDRALNALLAERPELRRKGHGSGVQRQSG